MKLKNIIAVSSILVLSGIVISIAYLSNEKETSDELNEHYKHKTKIENDTNNIKRTYTSIKNKFKNNIIKNDDVYLAVKKKFKKDKKNKKYKKNKNEFINNREQTSIK